MALSPTHKIIIITAPSGSGKTTIVRHLLEKFPSLAFSVSACTRAPRGNEKNGTDYYFISTEEFREKIEADEFAEYEMVYEGKYYGTLKSELNRIWQQKLIPLIDIDVKGALALQSKFPQQTLTVFIQPPSIEILKERLLTRGTETSVSIKERLDKAAFELSFANHFDKVILNDTLIHATSQAEEIVQNFISRETIPGN
jgi:guanylate kinase